MWLEIFAHIFRTVTMSHGNIRVNTFCTRNMDEANQIVAQKEKLFMKYM